MVDFSGPKPQLRGIESLTCVRQFLETPEVAFAALILGSQVRQLVFADQQLLLANVVRHRIDRVPVQLLDPIYTFDTIETDLLHTYR